MDENNEEVIALEEKIKSARIYLDLTKDEYNYEHQRKTSIENRVGFFLALIGALGVFLFSIFKLPVIDLNTIRQVDIMILIIEVLFIGFIYFFLIKSMVQFFKVLNVNNYDRIEVKEINENTINQMELMTLVRIVFAYRNATVSSRAKNENKAQIYSDAIKNLSVSLILIIAYYIISNLLTIGGIIK